MGATGIGVVLQLLAVPLYRQWLGEDGYGIVLFLIALIGYVGLLDLGFGHGAIKRMVEALEAGDLERSQRIQRCHLFLQVGLSLLGLAVFGSFALYVQTPPGYQLGPDQRSLLFVLTGVQFAFVALHANMSAVYVSHELFVRAAVRDAAIRLGSVALTVAAVAVYRHPIAFLASTALTGAVGFVVNLAAVRRYGHNYHLLPRWDGGIARDLAIIAFRGYLHRMGSVVSNSAHMLIIPYATQAAVLARYHIPSRIPEALNNILGTSAQTVLPKLTRDALVPGPGFARSIDRYAMIGLCLGLAFVLIPSAFGEPLLELWLRGDAIPGGALVVLLLGIYFALELYFAFIAKVFYALGNQHRLALFSLFNAVATIVLTIPMVRAYGIVGVAAQKVLIDLLQIVPMALVLRRHASSEFSVGRHLVRVSAALAIGIGLAVGLYLAGQALQTLWFLLALPLAAVVTVLVLAGLRLMPVPEGITRRWASLVRRS
jgi:O-antigen/teichoic acid export membrane protein